MAKKVVRKTSKKEFDFFFLVVVSVFTALTVLTAGFLTRSKQEFAARQRALDVAQLELIEAEVSPLPTTTPPTRNVTPRKN